MTNPQTTDVYEAVIDSDDADLPPLERTSGTLDPVLRVTIDNGYHLYELDVKRLRSITFRKLESANA